MQLTKSVQIVMALSIITGIGYVSSIDSAEAIVEQDGYRMAFCTNMAWTFSECEEQYDGYTWTDRFTVLIGANGFNEDSTKIDIIGGQDEFPIHVYSQASRIPAGDVVFMETGLDTGIFMGVIKMTGQSYDADGDGGNDMMRMNQGNIECKDDSAGGMSMFIFGMPFLSDFFTLTTDYFLPNAWAGPTRGGTHPDIDKTCTWNAMASMTQEQYIVTSSYDYAAKIKTEKQDGAVTVSFEYQDDPEKKTITATASHHWRLGEVHFDKDAFYVGEPVTFYIRDADLWTMHHGQPKEYNVVDIYSTSDSAGIESPVQFVMNHDHGDKNLKPDSDLINKHKYHKEGSKFHAPPTALTQTDSSGQWKVYLWWEPGGLFEVDTTYALNIMFHDDNSDTMQENVSYSMDVLQNGNVLNHLSATNQFTSSGHVVKQFEFGDRGSVTLRIYDIDLDDAETSFKFQVAPNSGNLFEIVKHKVFSNAWNDPRWDGYMHQHFIDLLPGRVYTGDLSENADVVKYHREVLGVNPGDKVCVKYYDRTQPAIMPDGSVGRTDSVADYAIEKCVDILGMPNKMADERAPIFN